MSPPDFPLVVRTFDGRKARLFKTYVSPVDGSLNPIYLTDRFADGQEWIDELDRVTDEMVNKHPQPIEYRIGKEVVLEEERTSRGYFAAAAQKNDRR